VRLMAPAYVKPYVTGSVVRFPSSHSAPCFRRSVARFLSGSHNTDFLAATMRKLPVQKRFAYAWRTIRRSHFVCVER
jgi:hypothetical protein